MHDLNGRTAVITGAASGIGLALAHRLGAAGMNLVLGDVEHAPLEAAARALADAGRPVATQQLDVRDLDQIRAFEGLARERFGNVHLLCNNAGVGGGGPVADPDDLELWRWTIDVNLWGVIYGCKVFLPAMLEHGEPAHVVNTASMAGLASAPMMGPYNVSKYGVVALSETLAKEMQLAESAVGVSVLCPAFVQTGIASSHRNLPAELRVELPDPTAFPGDGMQTVIEALVAGGLPSAVVADAVHDAIVENRFWILTHEETKPGILARAEQIVNGVNPAPLGLHDAP